MIICSKCGAELEENELKCPVCGEPFKQERSYKENAKKAADKAQKIINDVEDSTPDFDNDDIQKNKKITIISYLGVFFFIPLLIAPDSKFTRFHVNQGLLLFLAECAMGIILRLIKFGLYSAFAFNTGTIYSVTVTLLSLAVAVITVLFIVIGITNVLNGKAKDLPVIGKFRII